MSASASYLGFFVKPLIPPSQRRTRHLKGIVGRNFKSPQPQGLLSTFYTIHKGIPNNRNELPDPIYVSEVIHNSLNPAWRSKESSLVDDVNSNVSPESIYSYANDNQDNCQNPLGLYLITVVVWQLLPPQSENNSNNNSEELGSPIAVNNSSLHITFHGTTPQQMHSNILFYQIINFRNLDFLGPTPQRTGNFGPNTLLIEFTDGVYVQGTSTSPQHESAIFTTIPSKTAKLGMTFSESDFARLLKLRKRLRMIREQTQNTQNELNQSYEEKATYYEKMGQLQTTKLTVTRLQQELQRRKALLAEEKKACEQLKLSLLPRTREISRAEVALMGSRTMLDEERLKLIASKLLLGKMDECLRMWQWKCIGQLRTVFPIVEAESQHSINSFILPNSDFTGCDEEHIATALGYVGHLVYMLSKYLRVPLRYPITPMCSRSVIRDDVSSQATNKFPLYSRGVDRTRFEYAVFLLNKDVEQLLSSQNLDVERGKLRCTLPNLQTLLQKYPLG
mmetsp:Transcript_14494/g.20202  ORF Transcript_14494/g.20202 Transcript_14494/m.20202 type:complete len:506 (+) Transcript_14494:142-1659(+)